MYLFQGIFRQDYRVNLLCHILVLRYTGLCEISNQSINNQLAWQQGRPRRVQGLEGLLTAAGAAASTEEGGGDGLETLKAEGDAGDAGPVVAPLAAEAALERGGAVPRGRMGLGGGWRRRVRRICGKFLWLRCSSASC